LLGTLLATELESAPVAKRVWSAATATATAPRWKVVVAAAPPVRGQAEAVAEAVVEQVRASLRAAGAADGCGGEDDDDEELEDGEEVEDGDPGRHLQRLDAVH
jgi:hypothetical protein